jgi:hypothetical protein
MILGMSMGYFISIDKSTEIDVDSVPVVWRSDPFTLNKENLYNEFTAQEIDSPTIVLAQAILETGNFSSYNCIVRNNLFGLRRLDGSYMEFPHWTFSVAAYKKYIQKYSKPPEDYYQYLQDLGYAEDPDYITKLKQIVSKL